MEITEKLTNQTIRTFCNPNMKNKNYTLKIKVTSGNNLLFFIRKI